MENDVQLCFVFLICFVGKKKKKREGGTGSQLALGARISRQTPIPIGVTLILTHLSTVLSPPLYSPLSIQTNYIYNYVYMYNENDVSIEESGRWSTDW